MIFLFLILGIWGIVLTILGAALCTKGNAWGMLVAFLGTFLFGLLISGIIFAIVDSNRTEYRQLKREQTECTDKPKDLIKNTKEESLIKELEAKLFELHIKEEFIENNKDNKELVKVVKTDVAKLKVEVEKLNLDIKIIKEYEDKNKQKN
ncbi:hypothetical protein [Mesoplasma coleopterae]|uniref:hypothetical protein n=1 Tax=Mesoplasma coleopterae TaxID=324078 RepID=UPI000D02D1CD|nr:hypothetical protein [Mesoplasma coleopterae]AVN62346.1 hypothetical protein CG001_01645 [Mesoplasma coleopterae]AVN63034.1 hypothetical protein CG000_01805 [Mesoplasma coleopterae]